MKGIRRGLFIGVAVCVALGALVAEVLATPASSSNIIAVNWPEMKKEAKKLLKGYARWFRYKGDGYGGPVDVDITISVSPEKEYQISVSYTPTGPGAKAAKIFGQTTINPTNVYQTEK